jgi:hypothetical protein
MPQPNVILSEAPKVRSRRTRTNEIRALFALRSKARFLNMKLQLGEFEDEF